MSSDTHRRTPGYGFYNDGETNRLFRDHIQACADVSSQNNILF
jgi:hypothetical protein